MMATKKRAKTIDDIAPETPAAKASGAAPEEAQPQGDAGADASRATRKRARKSADGNASEKRASAAKRAIEVETDSESAAAAGPDAAQAGAAKAARKTKRSADREAVTDAGKAPRGRRGASAEAGPTDRGVGRDLDRDAEEPLSDEAPGAGDEPYVGPDEMKDLEPEDVVELAEVLPPEAEGADADAELPEILPDELTEDLPEDLAAGLGEETEPEDFSTEDLPGEEDERAGFDERPAPGSSRRTDLPTARPTPAAATRDSLHLYLREIGRFPILKPEEEQELARRVRDQNDQEAAFRLVSSHLRLVVKIAMDFQRRWMQNVLDLIQEGNVGLMRAAQKFDPEKGIKFSYYAAFWIKAYILKFIMDNWRMVKIGTTQAQRKLFYNLSKERQRLEQLGFAPTAATLSENLNVSEEEVREMEQRLSRTDMSLDVPMGEDSSATRMDFLPAVQPGIEEALAQGEIAGLLREHLQEILPRLSDKEREILETRLLTDSPVTLREIGEKYGVTRERVRQIEARLLQKLREQLSRRIEDFSAEWISDNE